MAFMSLASPMLHTSVRKSRSEIFHLIWRREGTGGRRRSPTRLGYAVCLARSSLKSVVALGRASKVPIQSLQSIMGYLHARINPSIAILMKKPHP